MTTTSELHESFFIAIAALRANVLRSVLTTLGVIIGIVTVTLMGTAINGLNNAFQKSIATLGADTLFIQRFAWFSNDDWRVVRNRRPLTLQNARDVERLATLASAVSVEASYGGMVTYEKKKARGVWIMGNTDRSIDVRGLSIAKGRWFSAIEVGSARNVCVLGNYLAERFFPNQSPLGHRVKVNDIQYEVVGVIDKLGTFFTGFNMDNQLVIPVTRFENDFQERPDYQILVKVKDVTQLDDAEEELRGILRKLRRIEPGMPDDFAINRQEAFLTFFRTVGGTIAAVGLFITSLSLFVGGIGIMNIMFVSVAERTKEIGIRKAIGAKRRSILLQFLVEAALITLFAGILGILVAWPLTLAINRFMAAQMSWWLVVIALLVSVLTGIIAGFIPAWQASKLDPVEALRAE